MKALIFDGSLRLADVPAPAPIPGEVIIKEYPYVGFRYCK
jgi:hypothetical protein